MMSRIFFVAIALVVMVACCSTAVAALRLGDAASMTLAGHIESLTDVPPDATIDDVVAGRFGQFKPLPGDYFGGMGAERSVWLRFSLAAEPGVRGQRLLRMLPPFLDHVALYERRSAQWVKQTSGDERPFSDRLIRDRAIVLPLELPAEATATYYLEVRQAGLLSVYLTLHTTQDLAELQARENLLLGMYFGVMLTLLVVNVLYGLALREWIFAAFASYLLVRAAFFAGFDGLLFQYAFPEHPQLVRFLLRVTFSLVVATMSLLVVQVLGMRVVMPRLAKLCLGCGALAALIAMTAGTTLFTRLAPLLFVIVLIISVAGVVGAAFLWRRRQPLGGLMMLAMLLLTLGHAFTLTGAFGLDFGRSIDHYGSQVSSVVIAIALHVTIALRVAQMKQARLDSERAAREAAASAHQERRARQEQADFVALLLHEVKTPLAQISAAATVLQELGSAASTEAASRYDTIHAAVGRLNALAEHSLARKQQGLDDASLQRSLIDPQQWLHEVRGAYAGIRDQRLCWEIPARLPTILADAEMLRVALVNLIDNALKYAAGDNQITVAASAHAGDFRLSVADRGPGLDAVTQRRAFDRHWRGAESAGTDGAGLGLYLVRRIIAAHGGEVAIEAVQPTGTRFVLTLPRSTQ